MHSLISPVLLLLASGWEVDFWLTEGLTFWCSIVVKASFFFFFNWVNILQA